MRGPHVHITGTRGWLQHHHAATTIDGADAAVRLLTREESDDSVATCDAAALPVWLEADRGGVPLPSSWARVGCDDGPEVLVPDGDGGFRILSLEGDRTYVGALPGARFATQDHDERAWFISEDGLTLRAYDAELAIELSELTLPEACDRVAVGQAGIFVAQLDGTAWRRDFETAFESVDLGLVAGDTLTSVIALERSFLALIVAADGRGRLVEIRGVEIVAEVTVPGLDCPTLLVAVDGDEFYLSERNGTPPAKTRFQLYRWRSGLLPIGEAREVRAFDGRFVYHAAQGMLASWSGGLRPLYGARTRYSEQGWVETVHFDSNRHLCQWDRVFIDACVPAGCSIEIEARTSDTLDPEDLVVAPVPPPGMTLVEGEGQLSKLVPLGPMETDDAGWETVLGFDDLGPDGDVPQLGVAARAGSAGWTTLEGFVTNAPGRYLWLRIRLHGTRSATPRVYASRMTYPRPNVLKLLPAFWSADPVQADQMARFLALFEAELTRTDALIRHLKYLFDPRSTPEGALEWLGSWVGMALDERIPLAARRTLVREAVELYAMRGTVPGMTRVIELVSGVEAVLIEGFRVRRADAPILGVTDGTMLGDVLPLGGSVPVADDVNPRLMAGWAAGMMRRDIRRRDNGQPCPEDPPPSPALEPGQEFYSAYAHRFTVVLIGDVCDERLAATRDAIEAWKPAHTVHSVCLTEAGVRVGMTARPGYSAISAEGNDAPPTGVLGLDLTLGAVFTMGPHKPLRYVREIPQESP